MDYRKLINNQIEPFLMNILKNPFKNKPDIFQALEISLKYEVDLHPDFIFYWNELSIDDMLKFLNYIKNNIFYKNNIIFFNYDKNNKRFFELIGVEHVLDLDKNIKLDINNSNKLLLNLGLDIRKKLNSEEIISQIINIVNFINNKNNNQLSVSDILSSCNFVGIRDKSGSYIGARMGRPEKAKMRKQFLEEKNVVSLFPVSKRNKQKDIISIIKNNENIFENFRMYYCSICESESIDVKCRECDKLNRQMVFKRYSSEVVDIQFIINVLEKSMKLYDIMLKKGYMKDEKIKEIVLNFKKKIVFLEKERVNKFLYSNDFESIRKLCYLFFKEIENYKFKSSKVISIKEDLKVIIDSVFFKKFNLTSDVIKKQIKTILGSDYDMLKNVKCVSSSVNKHHTQENVIKGFLREKYNLKVNKDATIRYDMIELAITHFKPKEIGTSVKKLKELGYSYDYLGNDLKDSNQIIEIFPQDIILPDNQECSDELASEFILKTGKYIDDLLVKFYDMKPFYNFKDKQDTIGHFVIGLAPHTSAGVIGRIIGYSNVQGCFAHPLWHAAQRRNIDGDENCIILLLDGLINFSKEFLPDRIGTRTQDVPLVLTTNVLINEVDDEVYSLDINSFYLEDFYSLVKKYEHPLNINVNQIKDKLDVKNIDDKYFNYYFSHNIDDINDSVLCSSYKTIPLMKEKLNLQMDLAKKLRSVDENKTAGYVIEKHFLKDMQSNLNKYFVQEFRCTNCNKKYRRPPLSLKCDNCGSNSINFTIHEGAITKYLNLSYELINNFDVDEYIIENIELIKIKIEGMFGYIEVKK